MAQKNTNLNLYTIMSVLLVLAIPLSLYARWNDLFPGDLRLAVYVQSNNSRFLRQFMELVSLPFGGIQATVLVVVIGGVVWWRMGRLQGILILAAGLISLINSAFKIAVNRPRPSPDMVRVLVIEPGNTFPSGHAFFATIFLGILAYLLFTHLKRRSLRRLSLVVIIILILLVGVSRVYLGAHWPSDILGSYVIGGFFLTVLIWGYEKARIHLKEKSRKKLKAEIKHSN